MVSMATKDRPAGRVLWSLDVGEKEKRAPPTSNISNANELFLFLHSRDNGCHSRRVFDKIQGLGKSLLV